MNPSVLLWGDIVVLLWNILILDEFYWILVYIFMVPRGWTDDWFLPSPSNERHKRVIYLTYPVKYLIQLVNGLAERLIQISMSIPRWWILIMFKLFHFVVQSEITQNLGWVIAYFGADILVLVHFDDPLQRILICLILGFNCLAVWFSSQWTLQLLKAASVAADSYFCCL